MDSLLEHPTDLDLFATNWRAGKELPGGLTLKYHSKRRYSGDLGIIKTGWWHIIIAELLWSRLARLVGLPAAPVQLFRFPTAFVNKHDLSIPFGSLIWLIPSENAPWLWKATSGEIEYHGICLETVAPLKALALWSNRSLAVEIGEFRIGPGGTPFLIYHQDAFFSIRTTDEHAAIDPQFFELCLPVVRQKMIANEFLVGLRNYTALNERTLEQTPLYELLAKLPMPIPTGNVDGTVAAHIAWMVRNRTAM